LDDGWFRVRYVAKFPEAVYVLHCFKKKSRVTSKQDKEIASSRYKAVIKERIKK
jgi:phage-related protein